MTVALFAGIRVDGNEIGFGGGPGND